MRHLRILALLPLFISAGCRSPYIEATVSNRTTQPIGLIEVAYPSASFGTQGLAPGADFHYRFKVLGSGDMKLTYTDSTRHEQKSQGPFLKEGAEGRITITITSDGTHWQSAFTSK
jgi:hypothetical protein